MQRLIALQPEVYEQLKQHVPSKHENIQNHILSDLDQKMQDILQSQRPVQEKMKLYNEVLQKSQTYRKKRKPSAIKTIVQKEKEPISELTLANRYRKKKTRARKVLTAVKKRSGAGWDVDGRFVFDNQPIPSSDIKKLLHSAVEKKDKTLAGWKEFDSISKWQTL